MVVSLKSVAAALICAIAVFEAAPAAAEPAFPFGSHRQRYEGDALRPSRAQGRLDRQTAEFYEKWKARYLRPGCKDGHYLVKADTADAMVVSEGQGYGMLIVAMMAGRDKQARKLFDGLFAYYRDHPSGIDGRLMSWAQDKKCRNVKSNDSATDGDMDAAYALLLADKQWGSDGPVDYRAGAIAITAGIRKSNVNQQTRLLTLGDWVTVGAAKYKSASRSSDWMTGHLRAFARLKPSDWSDAASQHLLLIERLQRNYAPDAGLLPDFVVNTDTSARPAPPRFLEAATDGQYSYNACRTPWRIGVDAATSGDHMARAAARRISRWARRATAGKPARLRDGYRLNGSPTVDYQTMAFVAPFSVAAMTDPDGQDWLDALWDAMVEAKPQGYYPDSIKLLSMLAVSRNWLVP